MNATNYREYIAREFKNYTDKYDSSDTKIKLKVEHTYHVALIAEDIARSLGLSANDIDIAWTCGMLHDIGRFEQVRRYGTFFDAQSVDHAQFGADILFTEGVYEQIVPYNICDNQRELIERVIRVHSMFRVPEDLDERQLMFANILRDADKLDILRVNCETPVDEVYNRPIEEFLTAQVSEEVKQAFREHHCAKRSARTTAIDYLVGHVCLVFELVYSRSVEIADEQKYIYQMLQFRSNNWDTREWFDYMKQEIRQYIMSKMEES